MRFYALLRSIGVVGRDCVGDCVRDCVRGSVKDDVRDDVRDEPLETPLNKGFLLENVRDKRFCSKRNNWEHNGESEEEFIDLKPIFDDLYIDSATFIIGCC